MLNEQSDVVPPRPDVSLSAGPSPEGGASGPRAEALAAPASVPPPASVAMPRRRRRPVFLALILLVAIRLGGGAYGWHWWQVGRFLETTDDAFLQADKVTVAPRVMGYVAQVMVADNQAVKAGDVMVRIDDRDYRVAYDSAKADVDKARAQIDSIRASVSQQQASVEQSRADVANAEAALSFSTQEAKRYEALLTAGAGTTQRSQQADSDLQQRTATLAKSRAALDSAQKQIPTLQALGASFEASLAGCRGQAGTGPFQPGLHDAESTDRRRRRRPLGAAGTIGAGRNQPPDRGSEWPRHLSDRQFQGDPGRATWWRDSRLTSRSTLSAATCFSARSKVSLPEPVRNSPFCRRKNATGNFTKIVQRVPVKILLAADDPMVRRLRPGLSVEATVDTRDAALRTPSKPLLVGEASTR